MAMEMRNPSERCIHHLDRGVQHACDEYIVLAKSAGLKISMSRRGNAYNNA